MFLQTMVHYLSLIHIWCQCGMKKGWKRLILVAGCLLLGCLLGYFVTVTQAGEQNDPAYLASVSYTHLDVYKRQFCNDKYHLLSAFEVYGIAVMYSEDKLIAWIRRCV